MKLLTFHLTDIFFCKNPKYNEFADDNVYRYICYSHILSIKSCLCQCFVYQTSCFSSPALTYFKLTLTFGFSIPLINSVPPMHPHFSVKAYHLNKNQIGQRHTNIYHQNQQGRQIPPNCSRQSSHS